MATATASSERSAAHLTVADLENTVGSSVGSAIQAFTTLTDVSQQVSRELLETTTGSLREGLRLTAKVQGAALDAVRDTFSSAAVNTKAVATWNRLLDTGARAFSEYAGQLSGNAERSTATIQKAVRSLNRELHADGVEAQ